MDIESQLDLRSPRSRIPIDGVPTWIQRLSWVLDESIPLTSSYRVGIDGLLSFIPVVGDSAGFVLSGVIILAGLQAGCSWATITRMAARNLGESLAGMIPLVGPVVSFAWKSNERNLATIRHDLENHDRVSRSSRRVLIAGTVVLAFTALALFSAAALMGWWILQQLTKS